MADFAPHDYDKTLVSYVDVLGFAELLKERTPTDVARLLTTMKQNFAAGGRVHRTRNDEIVKIFKSFNFSDLIVRTTRIEPVADVGEIIDWELYYLSENQLSLAVEGILIRGAICVDDLVAEREDSIVFGPALVRSYRLEREYAVYPRIVIDRDLIYEAKDEGYIATWQDFYSQGEDGAYFVDYLFGVSLTGLVAGLPGDQPNAEERIRQHRDMIVNFIAKRITGQNRQVSERIKQKWMWLALYHNSTMLRLKKRLEQSPKGRNLDQFLIPEDSLRF
jgi:hypothetical protein